MHLMLTLDIGGIWWETDLVMFSLGTKNAGVVQSVRFAITEMFVFQQYQVTDTNGVSKKVLKIN